MWKTIPGWERYEASNKGLVRRKAQLWRKNYRAVKVLKLDSSGRGVWLLTDDGLQKHYSVAYLVLLAFKGPPPGTYGKYQGQYLARHLDDNLLNSQVTNLAWGTAVDNMADAYRNGRRSSGWKHTKNARTKMSRALKGKRKSPEQIKKMSDRMKGNNPSETTRRRISRANKGKKRTLITRKRISASAVLGWLKRKGLTK